MSQALFMPYLMYLMTKKSFIYHFHLAGIVQLLHIFSLLYTIDANDANQKFVYFMGVLIASFFLMLCEVNISEIFISIQEKCLKMPALNYRRGRGSPLPWLGPKWSLLGRRFIWSIGGRPPPPPHLPIYV